MKPEDDQFQEQVKALEEIQDKMLKAGFIVAHGHTQQLNIARFTPDGQDAVTSIVAMDMKLGPLTDRQIVYLWKYCRQLYEQRAKGDR